MSANARHGEQRVTPKGCAVNYVTEANEWSAMLDAGDTLAKLRAGVARWAPYVSGDALVVLAKMDEAALVRWRQGLASERKKKWAGEAWQEEFAALLLPESLLKAGMVAAHFHAPFGTALIRIREEDSKKPAGSPSVRKDKI